MKIHILDCGYINISRDIITGGGNARTDLPKGAAAPAGRRTQLPVHAFLAELRSGLYLIDAGWSRAVSPHGEYDRQAAMKELPVHLAAMYRPYVPAGMTAAEQLASMGIRPSDLEAVIITHLDPDHVSGLKDLGGVRSIIVPEDEAYWSVRAKYKLRQPDRCWETEKTVRVFYRGRQLGPVNKAAELTEDGSIVYVNLPGHTDGQAGVMIRDRDDYVMIAADAAVSPINWETMKPPGYAAYSGLQTRTLAWLAKTAEDPACRALLCSHDAGLRPGAIEI